MKPSISLIIPALNEEENLEPCLHDVLTALGDKFYSYEIIIFDDGSTDQTGAIADKLEAQNPSIKVIHNGVNKGLGYSIQKGFQMATKEYAMWYPGDNGMMQKSLDEMFRHAGEADLIIPIIANPEFRTKNRQVVSSAYIVLLNFIFGLKLRYYNGVVIYRSDLIKNVKSSTKGFAFFAEILIRLVKGGATYLEVPTYHRERAHGSSKAFRWKNMADVVKMTVILIRDIHIKRERMVVVPTSV